MNRKKSILIILLAGIILVLLFVVMKKEEFTRGNSYQVELKDSTEKKVTSDVNTNPIEVENAGMHGAYGDHSNEEKFFSSHTYSNQLVYVKGIGEKDGVGVMKLDVIDSSRILPDERLEVENRDKVVYNHQITKDTKFFWNERLITKDDFMKHYAEDSHPLIASVTTDEDGSIVEVRVSLGL